MHPLLSRRSYLSAYLAVWVPLAGLLVFLIRVSGGITTTQACVLLLPMALLYAAACLSTWYTCRATPLYTSGIARVFATHVLAALLLSFGWVRVGSLFARALSEASAFKDLSAQYEAHVPILFVSGVFLYFINVGFFYVLMALDISRDAEARALETSVLARDAELRVLKAQINPHFLFNSLNSISALTSIDPARAREMCILLAEFLRMTLGMGQKNSIPLAEEIALLGGFLAIEKVRFGARLQVTQDIPDDCQDLLVPALLLQPLLENAVVHGVANAPEGGEVLLVARHQDGRLSIRVANTFDEEATPMRRDGMGLANVRQRLEARYPKSSSMQVSSVDGRFEVVLSLPAETKEARR
jgi:two-component system, LytTR family, sensor histidine kinase AlgZ